MNQNYHQNPVKRKAVVYARVSTEHEAQLSALENQIGWYKPILEQHPEWEIVRTYVDEGVTGTSAKKRPAFLRMIEDAGTGAFDLILTREVSRFARNTVDTLQYTRSLKAQGVEVYFINDNIKTFDGDGELRLTIMATLAQDESRKTSIRVKSGQQTSMEKGVVYGTGNILGYDRVGKEMVINPEQAKTVRMIFDWYLEGFGIRAIQFRLEQAGRLTSAGKTSWYVGGIAKVLRNSFYCGIMTYHKEFVPDFLEQKKIRNCGEIEFTRVKGSHEPIITEEEYNTVQEILESRRQLGDWQAKGMKISQSVWAQLLVCECGHKFNRKVWHKTASGTQYGYQCYSSIRSGTVAARLKKGLPIEGVCRSPMIPEWKLQVMAKHIFNEYVTNTDQVIALAESILAKHIDDEERKTDDAQTIEQKTAEQEKLNKRLNNLIEMRADGEITKDVFKSKKEAIEDSLLKLQIDIDKLYQQRDSVSEDVSYDDKIRTLKYYLEQSVIPHDDSDMPDEIISAFVSKIVVHENGFDWYLRANPEENPKSLTVEGKRKKSAKSSSLCSPPHRQLLTKLGKSNFVKIQEYTISVEDAMAHLHKCSTSRKAAHWQSINISLFL